MNLPFVQVALPILIGFITIGWWQSKRLDEMSKRLDGRIDESKVDRRLDRIELKLDNHGDPLSRLEERTALVRG
jgi:hypothetical protein